MYHYGCSACPFAGCVGNGGPSLQAVLRPSIKGIGLGAGSGKAMTIRGPRQRVMLTLLQGSSHDLQHLAERVLKPYFCLILTLPFPLEDLAEAEC